MAPPLFFFLPGGGQQREKVMWLPTPQPERWGNEADDGTEEPALDVDFSAIPLPPLPDPVPRQRIHGVDLAEIYSAITELRRLSEEETQHQSIRDVLLSNQDMLLAVAAVLHEAGMLVRTKVDEYGRKVDETLPLPELPPPQLPPGVSTWVYDPSRGAAAQPQL